jgi:hypothetical protein
VEKIEKVAGDVCCVECQQPVKLTAVAVHASGWLPVGPHCDTHGPRKHGDLLVWTGTEWYPRFCMVEAWK